MFLGIDLANLITTAGYIGIFLIIFSESGLLIGLLLPGDSLLFTAGFLASQGYLNIFPLILITFLGAILGDSFGYYFGRRVGYRIFTRENSLLFSKDHIQRAELFYEKYGPRTIILARFMPVIRTLAPILAGVGRMRYATFLLYNIVGGLIWGVGIPVLGYYLGNSIPNIDRYLLPFIIAVVVTSALPTLLHLLRNKQHRDQLLRFLKLKSKDDSSL